MSVKTNKKNTAKNPYHHGRLKESLIEAAASLGASEGVEAITLRRVAAAARVSPAAPYHHFANKADLLAAVADEGFRRMNRAMSRAVARVKESSDAEQLRAIGLAYIRFASRNPHYFRVMFRPELARAAQPERNKEGHVAFTRLIEAVQRARGEKGPPSESVFEYALYAWSLVHGLSSLWLDSALSLDPPFSSWGIRRMADRITRISMPVMQQSE
jgi:AcrR family transcriptional regulator